MRLRTLFIASALSGLIVAATTEAATNDELEPSYKQFITEPPEKVMKAKIYLEGIHLGYEWANARLGGLHEKPLYCVPPNLIVSDVDLLTMMKSFFDAKTTPQTMKNDPIGIILLLSLEYTFPCPDPPPPR